MNQIFSIKASNKIEIHINNMDLQYFKSTIGGEYKVNINYNSRDLIRLLMKNLICKYFQEPSKEWIRII